MNVDEYDFPVWGTVDGGLVRPDGEDFYFVVVPPNRPDLKVGEKVNREEFTMLIAANHLAQRAASGAEEFERGLEEFFNMAFDKVDRGEMTLEQVEAFFPPRPKVRRVRRVRGNITPTNTR